MRSVRCQIEQKYRPAFRLDLIPQQCRGGIDQAALHTFLGHNKFTLLPERSEGENHRLDRLAFEAFPKMFAPAHIESAVGGTQRFDLCPGLSQPGDPGAVRAESCPAPAAEGEYDRIGIHCYNAGGRLEYQCSQAKSATVPGGLRRKPHPFVTQVKGHA